MIIANDYIHCNLPELTPNVFFIKLPKNNAYNILYPKNIYQTVLFIYLFLLSYRIIIIFLERNKKVF